MNKYLAHLFTVLRHKSYVMKECFHAGLIWQGLIHDLSKFGLAEFVPYARFFQKGISPVEVERTKKGFSASWQHHKGRNPHHWQYWIDYKGGKLIPIRMPAKYLAEMICDWIGAGKAYNSGNWTPVTFQTWLQKELPSMILHPETKAYVECILEGVKANPSVEYLRSITDPNLIRLVYLAREGEATT